MDLKFNKKILKVMKKLILAIFFATITISCSKSEVNLDAIPINITPELVAKGNHNGSGNINQQNIILTNQNDWNVYLNRINEYNIYTINPVDFSNYQLIVVFDQVFGNGGHSIDITNVVENYNNITITVQRLQTGGLTTVISQPFHIVKIPKSVKPIVFV